MATQPAIPFSTGEALRFGWNKTLANVKPFLLLGVIGAFLALVDQAMTTPPRHGLAPLLSLGIQILEAALGLVYVRTALRLHDGQAVDLTRPAELLTNFFGYLLTQVLYGLIVLCGLILLIVPGVIWGLKFAFAGYLVVDQKLDPIEALKASSRLTAGLKGKLFPFALAVLGVNLLGAIALGIGLIVTIPTSAIATAYVFRRLQAYAARPVPAERALVPPPPATRPVEA